MRLRAAGAEVVTVNSFPATKGEPGVTRVFDIELRDLDASLAADIARGVPGVHEAEARPTLGQIFGKRVIVIGGGAQVSQVTLGAVRRNRTGTTCVVSGSPWTPSHSWASTTSPTRCERWRTCRAPTSWCSPGASWAARSPRAVRELKETGIPVISLNMVGSVVDAVDLVVSDPVRPARWP